LRSRPHSSRSKSTSVRDTRSSGAPSFGPTLNSRVCPVLVSPERQGGGFDLWPSLAGLSEKAPLAESKGGVFSCPMPTRRRGIVVGKAEGGWPRSPIRVLSSEGTVQLRVPHVSCFSRHGYHDRRHRGLYAAGLRIFNLQNVPFVDPHRSGLPPKHTTGNCFSAITRETRPTPASRDCGACTITSRPASATSRH
jgi:hypothetical protein